MHIISKRALVSARVYEAKAELPPFLRALFKRLSEMPEPELANLERNYSWMSSASFAIDKSEFDLMAAILSCKSLYLARLTLLFMMKFILNQLISK